MTGGASGPEQKWNKRDTKDSHPLPLSLTKNLVTGIPGFGLRRLAWMGSSESVIAAAILRMASSSSRSELSLSVTGTKARSISTESRGMSRTNRLIAVPPLSAKHASGTTYLSARTASSVCSSYSSASGIEFRHRHHHPIFRVIGSAGPERPLAAAEIDAREINIIQP